MHCQFNINSIDYYSENQNGFHAFGSWVDLGFRDGCFPDEFMKAYSLKVNIAFG